MLKKANLSFSVIAQANGNDVNGIQFSTQDRKSAKLIFTIKEGKQPLNLTDIDGELTLVMQDKSRFIDKVEVTKPLDGVLEYTLTQEQIRHAGRAQGEIKLTDKDGSSIGGLRFNFTIKKALMDEDLGPVKEFYINDLEAVKQEVQEKADAINTDIDSFKENVDQRTSAIEETITQLEEGVTESVVVQVETAKKDTSGQTHTNLDSRIKADVGRVSTRLEDTTIDLEQRSVNVKKYGAKGDGVTDDTEAIQACITDCFLNHKSVFFPSGTYITTKPIIVYTRTGSGLEDITSHNAWVHIIANSKDVIIKKTTQTAYNGKDCVLYVRPYNSTDKQGTGLLIENIALVGSGTGQWGLAENANEYGIFFSTAIASFRFAHMMIRNVKIGIHQPHNMYLGEFDKVFCWTKTIGFMVYGGENTSTTYKNCYAQHQTEYGYKLGGYYSSMQNCGADNISGTAYGLIEYKGTLIGCGAESPGGLRTFEADGSNVTIINPSLLPNQYDTPETSVFLAKNLSIVTVINGVVDSSRVINGVPTRTQASGKLFTISDNSRINFIGTKMPDLGFKEESFWEGLLFSDKVRMNKGDSYFNPYIDKPVWLSAKKWKNGDLKYVDSEGRPAGKYPLLANGNLEQSFVKGEGENNTNYTVVYAPTLRIRGNTNGTETRLGLNTKVDLSNFQYAYVKASGTFGLNNGNNELRIGFLTLDKLGTNNFLEGSKYFTTNFNEQVLTFNIANLKGEYYLGFRIYLGSVNSASVDIPVSSIIFSESALDVSTI